jgi:hypothetical protein
MEKNSKVIIMNKKFYILGNYKFNSPKHLKIFLCSFFGIYIPAKCNIAKLIKICNENNLELKVVKYEKDQ